MQYTFGDCKVPGVVCRGASIAPMLLPEVPLEGVEHLELTSCRAILRQHYRGELRGDALEGAILLQDPHCIIVGFAVNVLLLMTIHSSDGTSPLNKVHG